MSSEFKPIPSLTEKEIRRFWNSIDSKDRESCWNWKGHLNAVKKENGYGTFCVSRDGRRNLLKAHRVSFVLSKGDTGGLLVLHRCDNRNCCNPDHLFLGTYKDNAVDCKTKGRLNSPKGERINTAILSPEQVVEIREMYSSSGRSLAWVASKFGVSRHTIHAIVQKRNWRWLP